MAHLKRLGWFLLALPLSGCQVGPDLHRPSDARAYVRACALGADDIYIYCEAMLPTLAAVQGPVTVILPNMSDDERQTLLTALLAEKGRTVAGFLQNGVARAAFTRANVFALDRLTTGVHATLDGKPHQVVCGADGGLGAETCRIGDLQGWNHMHHDKAPTGSVYATSGRSRGALPFFRF